MSPQFEQRTIGKTVRIKTDKEQAAARGCSFKPAHRPPTEPCKLTVGVFGAGIAGLTAAHELAKRGFDVTVYEAAADPRYHLQEQGKWHSKKSDPQNGKNTSWRRIVPGVPIQLGGLAASQYTCPPDYGPGGTGSESTQDGNARLFDPSTETSATSAPLVGEHGFRFFPAYYLHLWDLLQQIPVYDLHLNRVPAPPGSKPADGPSFANIRSTHRTVYDNVVRTVTQGMTTPDGAPSIVIPRESPRSLAEYLSTLYAMKNTGYQPNDVMTFMGRVIRYMVTSPERRGAEYENQSAYDFLVGKRGKGETHDFHYEPNFLKQIRQMPRVLAAYDSYYGDARTIMTTWVQLNLMLDRRDAKGDGVLNGPTTEAWFDHWYIYLKRELGVKFHHAKLEKFDFRFVDPAQFPVDGVLTGEAKLAAQKIEDIWPEGDDPHDKLPDNAGVILDSKDYRFGLRVNHGLGGLLAFVKDLQPQIQLDDEIPLRFGKELNFGETLSEQVQSAVDDIKAHRASKPGFSRRVRNLFNALTRASTTELIHEHAELLCWRFAAQHLTSEGEPEEPTPLGVGEIHKLASAAVREALHRLKSDALEMLDVEIRLAAHKDDCLSAPTLTPNQMVEGLVSSLTADTFKESSHRYHDYYVLATSAHGAHDATEDIQIDSAASLQRLKNFVQRKPNEDKPVARRGSGDRGDKYALNDIGVQPWDRFQTLSGIQFFFQVPLQLVRGHVYYNASPWALSSICQQVHWEERPTLETDGYATVMSVDIGDWNRKVKLKELDGEWSAKDLILNEPFVEQVAEIFDVEEHLAILKTCAKKRLTEDTAECVLKSVIGELSREQESVIGELSREQELVDELLHATKALAKKPHRLGLNLLATEVWRQITDELDLHYSGSAADVLPEPKWFVLDRHIELDGKDTKNRAPYLVPIVGDFKSRPSAYPFNPQGSSPTWVRNQRSLGEEADSWQAPHGGYEVHHGCLVTAGTWTKTFTRITSMEAACESGRHAVHAILDHLLELDHQADYREKMERQHGANVSPEIWAQYKPRSLDPLQWRSPYDWLDQSFSAPTRQPTRRGDYCLIVDPENREDAEYRPARQLDIGYYRNGQDHPWRSNGVDLMASHASYKGSYDGPYELFPLMGTYAPVGLLTETVKAQSDLRSSHE